MKPVALLLVTLATALALEEPLRYYHETVGVHEAARIKQSEEAADFDGARIVGGTAAPLGAHPHMGGLVIALTTGAQSVCGSSLLSNTRLVTAAHCWWDGRSQARQFTVVLGSTRLFSGGVRVNTNRVAMHANWNPNNLNNDIAIITTNWIGFNANIQRVYLPSHLLNNNFAGTWATAAGFGRTADNVGISNNQFLSHVTVQVITNAVCQQTFGSAVVASTLCTSGAGGRGPCGMDSGGPLVITSNGRRTLIAAVSFGSSRGCTRGYPTAYARITSFDAWIRARL